MQQKVCIFYSVPSWSSLLKKTISTLKIKGKCSFYLCLFNTKSIKCACFSHFILGETSSRKITPDVCPASLHPALYSLSVHTQTWWPKHLATWLNLSISVCPNPPFFLCFSSSFLSAKFWKTLPRSKYNFIEAITVPGSVSGRGLCSTWEDFLLTRQCLKKSNRWLLVEGTWG